MDLRALIIAIALLAVASCDRDPSEAAPVDAPPSIAYEMHVRAGGAPPPAGKMENPFRDEQSAKEGEKLFAAMNCDGCHGGGALGWVGPSLVDGRWRYGGGDGEQFHSIYFGRPRGMPAYGGMLPTNSIWKIVTYINAQPLPKNIPTESWSADASTARTTPVREEKPGR